MVELEKAGVPTVSFTARSFGPDAYRSAQAFGLPNPALAWVSRPLTNQSKDQIRREVDGCIDQVIKGLTQDPPLAVEAPKSGAAAERLTFEGTDQLEAVDRMTAAFIEKGWSDGFPLVAPTADRVERMLRGTRRTRDEVVAVLEPGFGIATVEKIAINCVLAGCAPEHLPVLIAAVQAIAEPKYFLRIVAMSTGPHTPLLMLNGPVIERLGLNSGRCAIGPGSVNHANVVIGRALRLILMNVGHAYPGTMDLDTIGSTNKFSLCIAENEAANPWAPFHVDRGYRKDKSTVTAMTVYGVSDVFNFPAKTAAEVLDMVAWVAKNPGVPGTGAWLEGAWVDAKTKAKALDSNLVLLCPEHAAIIAGEGWSKADIRAYLYERATLPFSVLRSNREPWTLRAARPDLQWMEKRPDLELPLVETPDCYEIAVLGGAGGRSAYGYGANEAITKPIETLD